VLFKQQVPKTGIEGAVMRCASRIQGKKLAGRVRQRWDERYTLHANHAGCKRPVYSSIYGEALAQKKQSWWISTTACGDFQPKKILIQTAPGHLPRIGQPRRRSKLHRD
jgi:hypothetical protein